MTPLAMFSLSIISTLGASDTSRFVMEQEEIGWRLLQGSYALGLGGKGVFDELYNVAAECRAPNWDGYGALPIDEQTLSQARRFLAALPLGIPPPSVGAEPDGHLTLEWYRSPRYMLSVSVSPDDDLHYAALLGLGKAYGTEPFFGVVPQNILDLIHRVDIS